MNEARIKEVFSDEAFVKEMVSKDTPAEVKALLAEKGIDVSENDILQLRKLVEKKLSQAEDSEELDENDLEDVAGGFGPAGLGIAIWVVTAVVLAGGFGGLAAEKRW